MIGFRNGVYGLTREKAEYWHRSRGDDGCRTVEQMLARHLVPTFTVEVRRPDQWNVTGPGIADDAAWGMFEALSGRASLYGDGRKLQAPPLKPPADGGWTFGEPRVSELQEWFDGQRIGEDER